MKRFIAELRGLLDSGRDAVVAAVVAHAGSTPRSSGAMMAILKDGSIRGSVGGGILEAKVMELAPSLFENGGAVLKPFLLTGAEAASLGMACGGDVTVFALHVPATPEQKALYAALAEELDAGRQCYLLTDMDGPDEVLRPLFRRLLREGEAAPGFPKPGRLARLAREERGLRLLEPFAPAHALHLAGAGHVSFFTARLAAGVGFQVTVLDDREEFANRERFPEARAVRVVPDFADCFAEGLGPRDFAAIMTRGHLHDKTVLARALNTQAGYIGMIGSKKKRASTYAALLKEGFAQSDLDRVHCPIGLAIGAETPEEIAVSIVGELIKARAGLDAKAGA